MFNRLHPTMYVGSITELNHKTLLTAVPNLKAITWDLDKTLIDYHGLYLPPEHVEKMQELGELGLRQGIISNANSEARTARAVIIADHLSDMLGQHMFLVTSRMVGGKKKPLRSIFTTVTTQMGVKPVDVCHVGDQLFKDVFGANQVYFGASVLVAPYGEADDAAVKYLQRPLEAAIRPFIGLPFLTKNFSNV